MSAATAARGTSNGSTAGNGTGAGAGSRGRWGLWVAIALGLVVVALVVGGPRAQGHALDPGSTSANGTKALVTLLDESGATVEVRDTTPGPDTDVALLLSDTTTQAMTDELLRWVQAGGVLVVTDPASSFSAAPSRSTGLFGFLDTDLSSGDCTIDALGGLDRVRPQGGSLLEVPVGAGGCFSDPASDGSTGRASAFVVDQPTGSGHIVSIGSPGPFTNDALAQVDDAGLAVGLLAPRTGTRVAVLWGMSGGAAGSGGLLGQIPTGVRLALWQLAIAFAVYAWWRGRRLGKPVLETAPVLVGGSELVVAVGNLLQQTRDPDRAARLLRSDLRRQLGERLGVPRRRSAPTSCRPSPPPGRAPTGRWWTGPSSTHPVTTDDQLLDLARDIDRIRTEVLHGTARLTPSARSRPRSRPDRPPAPGRAVIPGRARSWPCATRWPRWWSARRAPSPAWSPRCWCEGHVLLEGVPGRGQDAAGQGAGRRRSTSTSSGSSSPPTSCPSDVIGPGDLRPQRRAAFRFREGPVFTNLLLADEINRTPPKTQAALLEAMEERQVSIEGEQPAAARPVRRRRHPEPGRVRGHLPAARGAARPVPVQAAGRLPELRAGAGGAGPPRPRPRPPRPGRRRACGRWPARPTWPRARAEVERCGSSPPCCSYIVALCRATRESPVGRPRGVAPRRHRAAARGQGVGLAGRAATYVTPDEVKAVAKPTLRHRMLLRPELELEGATADGVLDGILAAVPAPR